MGEGWGEGERFILLICYTPPPLAPSCLPQQVREGMRKKVIIALPPVEGKRRFYETIKNRPGMNY